MIEQEALSLFDLLHNVKTELKSVFVSSVWVVAEIMECSINNNGHCYLELVEKDQLSDKIIAKSKATIWAGTCSHLMPYFESVTGETLRVGMKVLVRANVEMSELYGFSLNILDIDAQYTMGDIAQQRAKVIEQLTLDGVIEMNKRLELPLVIQRVAVISSATAAGWGDFRNQIEDNEHNYDIQLELFPALMQGDGASASIIDALNQIFARIDEFDAVAIMRGGGSKSDLSCFDQYDLAYNAVQFPLPIITGIGHERDDSVLDLVANVRLKTPTAVATFIIDRMASFEHDLDEKFNYLIELSRQKIDSNMQRIDMASQRYLLAIRNSISIQSQRLGNIDVAMKSALRRSFDWHIMRISSYEQKMAMLPKIMLNAEFMRVGQLFQRLDSSVKGYFDLRQKQLEKIETINCQLDPQNVLKRGYAIVTSKGKTVKSDSQVKSGDELTIQVADGRIEGFVK